MLKNFQYWRDLPGFETVVMENEFDFLYNSKQQLIVKCYKKSWRVENPFEVYQGEFNYAGKGEVRNKLIEKFATPKQFLEYLKIDITKFDLN